MKINFTDYDLENFLLKEGELCGIKSTLIQPNHIGTKFTQKNKILRSSVWLPDGNLLSGSFFKFVNWGENPENFPLPDNIVGWTFVEKIDGSCVIVDYINGMLSARTRGTFSYKDMDNAVDFDAAFQKYPLIEEFVKENPHYSLLLEIVTPNLKIVLNYGDDVDFFLTGCVDKRTYTLLTQKELDIISSKLGIKRPIYYTFTSIEDLLEKVITWKGKEGVVAYSPNGQHLLKIKSDWYKKLHAAKENFRNIESVIDVWFSFGEPNYTDFVKQLSEHYDYETMLICQGYISRICDASKEVKQIIDGMKRFVDNTLKSLPTRKDQAVHVIASYGISGRQSMVFKLLDGKELVADDKKKILFQVLKK